jgi:hypothetical protein
LSEALNICRKTAIKFGGGGPALCGIGVFGCSLLIFHSNFLVVVCVKSSRQTQLQKIWSRTNSSRLAYIKVVVRKDAAAKIDRVQNLLKKGAGIMATYRDPVRCFAPLEVLERLLEIRFEAGFSPSVYLLSPDDLADYLDAYGFDVYALSEAEAEFHFGDYRASLAPGGDHAHSSLTAH